MFKTHLLSHSSLYLSHSVSYTASSFAQTVPGPPLLPPLRPIVCHVTPADRKETFLLIFTRPRMDCIALSLLSDSDSSLPLAPFAPPD